MLILYQGGHPQRVSWTLLMFTLGAVGIARVAIEQDRTYSMGYAAILGIAAFIAMSRFADSPIFSVFILVVIAYLADVIVRDCTLIDEDADVSGQGLIDSGRLFVKHQIHADVDSTQDDTESPVAVSSSGRRVQQPGRTVMYLALGALPLFGIGQFFLRNTPDIWARAQALLAFYLFASLSLLVTTSFLGLRRYLRQRRVDMPKDVSVAWLAGGLGMIALVLGIAFIAPMPGTALATFELPALIDSPGKTMASRFGWGDEGADQSTPDAAKTSQDPDSAKKQSEAGGKQSKPGSGSQSGAPPGKATDGNRQQGPAGKKSGGKAKQAGKQPGPNQGGKKQSNEQKSGSKPSQNKQQGGQKSESKKPGSKQSKQTKSNESKGKQSENQSKNRNQQDAKQKQASQKDKPPKDQSKGGDAQQEPPSPNQSKQSDKPSGKESQQSESQDSKSGESDQNDSPKTSQKQNDRQDSSDQNSPDKPPANEPNQNQKGSDDSGNQDDKAENDEEVNSREQAAADQETSEQNQSQSDGLPPEGSDSEAQPTSSEPGMMESVADSLPGVASVLRFLIFATLIAIVGVFLWLNRHLFAAWWSQLWGDRESSTRESIDDLLERVNKAPPRPFSSFHNPVGQESDLRKIVVITFQAFEAWTREQGAPRDKDETPSEFIRRVCHGSPQISGPAQQVVEAYNRVVYGRGNATPTDVSAAQQVWSLMQAS